MLVIATVAAKAHEIFDEAQADGTLFFSRLAAHISRGVEHALGRNFSRRNLFEELLDAARVVFIYESFFQRLQVNGRAVVSMDFAEFIARDDVQEKFALFKTMHELFEEFGANLGAGFAFCERRFGIEQATSVVGLVEVVPEAALGFFVQEIHPPLGGIDLGAQVFEALFDRGKLTAQVSDLSGIQSAGRAFALKECREQTVVAGAAGGFVDFFFKAGEVGAEHAALFDKTLVLLARLTEVVGVRAHQNKFADEIEKHRVENVEAIRVVYEIAEQDVMLEEKIFIVTVFDKQEAVLQQVVCVAVFVAEKRTAGFCERAVFNFAPDFAKRFADLPEGALPVGLNVRNLGAHHVRLLTVLEVLSASANPILTLDDQAGELAVGLKREVLQKGELIQDVCLDGPRELGARERFLQNFGEQFSKGSVFRRAGLLAVFAIKEIYVDGLAHQVAEVLFAEFGKARAQEHVIMNVVDADAESAETDFGGIRLQLHPGRMGGGTDGANVGHVRCRRVGFSL
ncbi:MAG: hypothetical protein WA823_21210 [Candidatus Acidiferrales bacterium]